MHTITIWLHASSTNEKAVNGHRRYASSGSSSAMCAMESDVQREVAEVARANCISWPQRCE